MLNSNGTQSGKSILWISFFQARGLDNASLLNILIQLAKFGHPVSLITVKSTKTDTFERKGLKTILFPLKRIHLFLPLFFTFLLSFHLPLFILTSKIDIVIMEPSVHVLSAFPSLLISKFTKTKFVLDIRSTPVETDNFGGKLLKLWFSISVLIAKKYFNGFTIITPQMRKRVSQDFKLNSIKMGIWTSGVSQVLFNPEKYFKDNLKLRKKLDLEERFVVFYHGIFTATRGLQETVKAMAIVKQKYPNIVLFLLGTGPILTELKTLVQKDGLQQNVIIASPVEQAEVPKFISMCDVTISPLPDNQYWRFQSPLKLLEYLAMEKVVILTDMPAHRAVVGDAKSGIYLSSIKPTEIAKAIEYAYLNKSNLEQWGKEGGKIVNREYTWEKVVVDLEEYLKNLDNSD